MTAGRRGRSALRTSEKVWCCPTPPQPSTHLTKLLFCTGAGKQKGRGRKRPDPEWDPEEEWPVEAILDKRLATKEDNIEGVIEGDILYLVAWEGWDSSFNSWQPESGISDDLIDDYERRADEAEAEVDGEAIEQAEEAAAAAAVSAMASEGTEGILTPMEAEQEPQTSQQEVSCAVALF